MIKWYVLWVISLLGVITTMISHDYRTMEHWVIILAINSAVIELKGDRK